jgi:hypothetical protein
MSNSQWSNEQPPAWQGPNAPADNIEPPAPSSGWKEQRLSVLLGLTWGLFSKNAKRFLTNNILVVILGALATLALLRLYPVELSAMSQSLLNGDSKPLDDALKANKDVQEQTKIIVDTVIPILKLYALTVPLIAITSLIASALATKVGLDNSEDGSNVKINWFKLLTTSLASFVYLIVGLVPVVILTLVAPSIGAVAFFMFIPYLIWVGLGFALLYPIVMAENLGGFTAVKRSLLLTRNNRKIIVLVILVVGILSSLPGAALNQFMLLIPSSVLNYVETTTMASFAGMFISVPITSSALVILYRYLHAKFHN